MKVACGLLILAVLFFLQPEKTPKNAIQPEPAIPIQEVYPAEGLPLQSTENTIKNIESIDSELSKFSELEFTQFSEAQLAKYNSLVMKKAELLKNRIFEKYFSKYGIAKL